MINQIPRQLDTDVMAAHSSGANNVRGLAAFTAGIVKAYTRQAVRPNPLRFGAYPANRRVIHVNGFAQFIDVFIAIAEQVDERLNVECQR